MENQSSQNVKNALCYIPGVSFFLYFAEEKKTPDYERHMKYGMILFGVFTILLIFLRSVFLGFVFLMYISASAFFAYRAYNGEDVKIKFIDDLFDKKQGKKDEEKKKDDVFEE